MKINHFTYKFHGLKRKEGILTFLIFYSIGANEHIQRRFVWAKAPFCQSPFKWPQLPVAATDCLHIIRLRSTHMPFCTYCTKIPIISHLIFLIFFVKKCQISWFSSFLSCLYSDLFIAKNASYRSRITC